MRSLRTQHGSAVLLLALSAAVPLLAQQPQTPTKPEPAANAAASLPAAKDVIARHIAAIGGRAALLKHTSSHAIGTLTMAGAGISAPVNIYSAAPNKKLFRASVPGIGDLEEGFNGTVGWTLSPMTGPVVLKGKELEQRKLDSDFYGLEWEKQYQSATTMEQTTFDGRLCNKLRLVRHGGGEDYHFFDVATGLRAGGIITRDNAMGVITATGVESDYKRFGGILFATKLTQTMMSLQQVITIASIDYDKVDPSVFDPPAQIKALIK